MVMPEDKNQVPGCLLRKHRSRDGERSDARMMCDEVCAGCGWTEEERYRRSFDIQHGAMKLNERGLMTLYVKGNGHQHV